MMKMLVALLLVTSCEAATSSPSAGLAAGPSAIEMTVATSPPGAGVTVDGVALGEGPVKVKMNPGPHRARASMSGYYPAPEVRFQVGATEPKEVTVTLMASH